MGWRVGVVGIRFLARVLVLNEETFELEREEQKKRVTCKSTFKKIPASCKPASHLVRVYLRTPLNSAEIPQGVRQDVHQPQLELTTENLKTPRRDLEDETDDWRQ